MSNNRCLLLKGLDKYFFIPLEKAHKMRYIKAILNLNWPFRVIFTIQPFMCPFFSFYFVFSK